MLEEAEHSGLPGRRGTLRQVLRAHAAVLERLTTAIAAEHRRELERVERSPGQRQLEHVRSLLGGEPAREADDGSPTRSLEQGLGYALDCEHLAVIARGALARESSAGARGAAAIGDCCASRTGEGDGVGMARWTTPAWRCASWNGSSAVSELDVGVSLAVGEPARGLAGWRQTHRQAQAALLVALRRPRRLTRYADVALLAAALKDEALGQSADRHLHRPVGGGAQRQTGPARDARCVSRSPSATHPPRRLPWGSCARPSKTGCARSKSASDARCIPARRSSRLR